MNSETKLFIDSISNNLDKLIEAAENHKEEKFNILYVMNLKFTKQFILEYAKLNGYEG